MHSLYILSVWLHILAATIWVGGMLFLVLVVVPWLRSGGQQYAGLFLRETATRFRSIAWWCFGVVLVTGTFNLWMRGVRFGNFVDPQWLASPFGSTVAAKLAVFALVLAISARHDWVVGPQASAAIAKDPRSEEADRLRRAASLHGRLNTLLALLLLAIGVMIVRGRPW